ncbi:unnamed protein product [Aphanomyces euteiches]|uniref:Bulb-type lectin domain-containing protein n=1 Tax=Aphanomyces euteiches TaxID=100861 RepID=A0A6G0X6Z7_9STRA|nr:hypothetical protein Ae201684_007801 [Aphanomyces euteiches]KAH9145903.1 hypothetical protein AeRB84_010205 [Aphanomyces euteiches]
MLRETSVIAWLWLLSVVGDMVLPAAATSLSEYCEICTSTPALTNVLLSRTEDKVSLNFTMALVSRHQTARLRLQEDSNIVVLNDKNEQVWQAETAGRGGARLLMQDDGNLVLLTAKNVPVWATNTSLQGKAPYCLLLRDDGGIWIWDANCVPWNDPHSINLHLFGGLCCRESYHVVAEELKNSTWNATAEISELQSSHHLSIARTMRIALLKLQWVISSIGLAAAKLIPVPFDYCEICQSSNASSALLSHWTCMNDLTPLKNLESQSKKATAWFQRDSNLVVYDGNKVKWSANTRGRNAAALVMQVDGNLVMITDTLKPVWASDTSKMGQAPFCLHLQDDATLTIWDGRCVALWQNGRKFNPYDNSPW